MDKNNFLDFLSLLEGFKVKFRELHWNSELLSEHELCDEIMSKISVFQDNFAEEGFVFFEHFENNGFSVNKIFSYSTKETLQILLENTNTIREQLINNSEFVGLLSVTDSFIHNINKFIYLCDFK